MNHGRLPRARGAQVYRCVCRVHPIVDEPAEEFAFFNIRRRDQSTTTGSSRTTAKEHAWELEQLAPGNCYCANARERAVQVRGAGSASLTQAPLGLHTPRRNLGLWGAGRSGTRAIALPCVCPQVAYLEPGRFTTPLAVRRVLRDAHARLGGAACGSTQALFSTLGRNFPPVELDGAGRLVGQSVELVELGMAGMLQKARAASERIVAFCQDLEAVRRAGLPPGVWHPELSQCELRLWQLEGLAWWQQQQRRGRRGEQEELFGDVRWERPGRGGAGRRGRRRREPGVVFELGPWGEERWPLSHEEAVWAWAQWVRL